MKRIKICIAAIVLAAALTLTLTVTDHEKLKVGIEANASAAADAATQSYQDQIAELEAQQEELRQQINDLSDQQANAMDIKANMDALAGVTGKKIEAAEALSEQLASQIADLEEKISAKEAEIESTKELYRRQIVLAYEMGDTSYLDLILGAEDMGTFLSNMDNVSNMLAYENDLRVKYENEKAELEQSKSSLVAATELQETVLSDLEADKAEYEVLADQQATIINSLQDDISAANEAYEAAKAAENQLDQELQAMLYQIAEQERLLEEQRRAEEAARAAAAAAEQQDNDDQQDDGTGTDADNVFVGGGFGWRTLGGYSDYHRGVDIPAPYGTPIHASKGGQVLTATGHGSYGNYVLIDHGNGEATLYAHMSSLGCYAGQYVNQGDVIGYVGSTGYSTGNHLHFEVRIAGEAQNPLNYVSPY